MDLLDRYLGAIAALLPATQRQDIVAELRDLLLSRIEDKEAQLGRKLDKKELEALLREFGHPLAVAGRYGPQRALIGVELYPFYIFAVKAALAIAAVVALIPAVIGAVTDGGLLPRALLHAFNDFLPTALKMIGVITIVGAMIERGWIKAGDFGQWKVSDLPYLSGAELWGKKPWFKTSRFDALFEVVATALFILWWVGAIDPIGRGPWGDDGELRVTLAPIVDQLHGPILVMAIGQLVSGLMFVLRPAWVAPRAIAEILLSIAGIALAAVLWRHLPLFTFGGSFSAMDGVANLQRVVDQTVKISIVVSAAICAGKIVIDGWRLATLGRRP